MPNGGTSPQMSISMIAVSSLAQSKASVGDSGILANQGQADGDGADRSLGWMILVEELPEEDQWHKTATWILEHCLSFEKPLRRQPLDWGIWKWSMIGDPEEGMGHR